MKQTRRTTMQTSIKKFAAALVVGGVAAFIPTTSHAFTSITKNTVTASVAVGGGSTSMTVALLNVSNNAAASTLGWTANAGGNWTIANQYLQITSHMSQSNGAFIQTYTDNTSATANPKYTGTVNATSPSPAGLINAGNTAATPLPTAWSISTGTPVAVDDPNCNGTAGQPAACLTGTHTGYAWFYHNDKAQVANNSGVTGPFVNGASYVEVETAGVPANIQFAQGSFGPGATSGVNNMYFEANFASAVGGTTYGSNTITVELATP
jgi:hypothetical protein